MGSRAVLVVVPWTALATFLSTLFRCYHQLEKEVPYDSCSKIGLPVEECTKSLCPISVYGGCTDKGNAIFVEGFSLLCIQLLLLTWSRLVFLRFWASAELAADCGCCECSASCCMGVNGC